MFEFNYNPTVLLSSATFSNLKDRVFSFVRTTLYYYCITLF